MTPDRRPAPVRIALGGPMAVGKSTVGRALAADLGVPFVDLDAQIGPDIPAIFAAEGEAGFRVRETAALTDAAAGTGVLALGGGALVAAENRALLADWAVVVLMATPAELERRLGSAGRPLAGRWRELLEARRGVWATYGAPIDTDGLDVAAVVEQVRARC